MPRIMMYRTEREIITEIDNIYCRLSPENLTCDGELSIYQSHLKYKDLKNRLKDLFKELGREMDETEAMKYLGKY